MDVFAAVAALSWDELRPHILDVPLDDVRLHLLSLEGLLKTKSGVHPKDRMDAAAIASAIEELKRR